MTLSCLKRYKTLVFDCDGVLLNSNSVKTRAFYQAALPYGEEAAQALVDYHVQHGGVSRYRKFDYFLSHIVSHEVIGPSREDLLESYASMVHAALLECEIADGILELRYASRDEKWLVISGGDQAELRDVFSIRGLDAVYDGGIFGSPNTKFEIVSRELGAGNILKPALMFGDSRLDHEVAIYFGLDFAFVYNWSEFLEWKTYVAVNNIRSFATVEDALMSCLPLNS
jgi:phosphoglycolate phosphatase-like HAD superfamily hydrolase